MNGPWIEEIFRRKDYLLLRSGTNLLYLLIRVSQVRDLHGLPASADRPCRGIFRRIRVSKH
jgi:hypothetical protein